MMRCRPCQRHTSKQKTFNDHFKCLSLLAHFLIWRAFLSMRVESDVEGESWDFSRKKSISSIHWSLSPCSSINIRQSSDFTPLTRQSKWTRRSFLSQRQWVCSLHPEALSKDADICCDGHLLLNRLHLAYAVRSDTFSSFPAAVN